MKVTRILAAMVAAAALTLTADNAAAQSSFRRPDLNPFNNILSRPTVSPYLNLLRNQGFGAPNYQTLVRPELEARRQLQQQQHSINQLHTGLANQGQQLQRAITGEIRSTGHTTTYRNYSHYFPTLSR